MPTDTRMGETEVSEYARQLFSAHGTKAVAEAADKARKLDEQGRHDDAAMWRRIEAALISMRGPNAS